MRYLLMFLWTVAFQAAAADGQGVALDSQLAQSMLTEIRLLRQDLQNLAATIQRVQIVMYRHQAQAAIVDRASQRRDNMRFVCENAETQQKAISTQIEQAEDSKRNSQSPSDQKAAEEAIFHLKSSADRFAVQAQQCQGEQIEAEAQFRTEQAKMNELENQLDQLDQALASHVQK